MTFELFGLHEDYRALCTGLFFAITTFAITLNAMQECGAPVLDRTTVERALRDYHNQEPLVAYLQRHGIRIDSRVDVEKKRGRGDTLLHVAAGLGYSDLIDPLIGAGIDPNSLGPGSRSPLHVAAWNNHGTFARFLLMRGAMRDAADSCGNIPLHWAAHEGSLDMAGVLLEADPAKEDVRRENRSFRTPVHVAAMQGHVSMVRLLIFHADLHQRDEDSRTAAEVALHAGHGVLFSAMEQYAREHPLCGAYMED